MTAFDIAGLFGVAMVLLAYAATTFGRLSSKGAASLLINLVGACLILLSLTRKFNFPAALVEAAWALIALAGLIRLAIGQRRR